MNNYIPQVGDIVFVNHMDSFISKLFSKIMGSKWSHTALVYGTLNEEPALLETNDYCVNVNYLNRYLTDSKCRIQILRRKTQMSDEEKSLIQKQGRELIGQMYGYLQLPVGALRRIISLKIPRFIKQGLWCCDVPAYACIGIDWPMKDKEPETYDTQELYEVLNSQWDTVYYKEAT